MTNEEIDKRIKMVRDILLSISKENPDDLNFLLLKEHPTDPSKNGVDFVFNISDERGINMLLNAANEIFLGVHKQVHYKNMARNNEGFIVYCINNNMILKNHIEVFRNNYYNVLSVRKIDEEIYYDLEGIDTNFEGYVGYNSLMFTKVKPFYVFN
jgi:hypothetical protein